MQAGPCRVVQKKSVESDGYSSFQIGFDELKKADRANKPINGHFRRPIWPR